MLMKMERFSLICSLEHISFTCQSAEPNYKTSHSIVWWPTDSVSQCDDRRFDSVTDVHEEFILLKSLL